MNESDIIKLLAIGAGAMVLVFTWMVVRALKRKRAVAEPFPPEWRALLRQALPLYARMPADLRERLEPLVRAFLQDVRFVGSDGLVVTDEMRLVVATQACLLTVSHNPKAYRELMSVLIYPDTFVVNHTDEDETGIVTEIEDAVSGEAQDTTRIVLSWRDVNEPPAEGEIRNVVLHEFAHYLDNSVEGVWHDRLEDEFDAHIDALESGDETLIDPDGAEHPTEFFAYTTEAFFEEPAELKRRHPRLYEGFKTGYGLDPAAW
jgi:Mlc titration factor MtfA (ptsG expression regulator)